jgi:hypothetical protein
VETLNFLIRDSLLDLVAFISRTGWRGREREAVSLYAFGFLAPKCRPDGLLRQPTQLGLDVAVRQVAGPKRKSLVCKDLVIWPDPAGTCWDESGQPTRSPLAILEWKCRTDKIWAFDEKWLQDFSKDRGEFIGYAISLRPSGAETTISATRVRNGSLQRDWLKFPS